MEKKMAIIEAVVIDDLKQLQAKVEAMRGYL